MQITFRQGLISFQKDAGAPGFLKPSGTSGYVTQYISPTNTVVTFAQGGSDYLQVFGTTVDLAWGPLTGGVTNYLYWDIGLLTGAVTRGITLFAPVVSSVAPSTPANDQHWFDLSTTTMFVWSTAAAKWQPRVRVFAGSALNGSASTLVMETAGSQVGLNTNVHTGFIMRDSLLQPLRKSNGEFLTNDDSVLVDSRANTGSVLVQPNNSVVMVKAGQNIPAMSLVYFSAEDTVSLASSDTSLAKAPVGIITTALSTGDLGPLAPLGEITYDQWDWSANIGASLYLDTSGQITLTRPTDPQVYRVARIKNSNTVLFEIDSETTIPSSSGSGGSSALLVAGTSPIVASVGPDSGGNNLLSISAPSIQPALDAKANLVHTHVHTDITDFAEAVDDRAASLIRAGSNITIVYDDTANTLTFNAAAQAASSYGTTLITQPDAASARGVLGLGTAATAASSSFAPIGHVSDTANPHSTTKAQVGLGNVDNTSDVNKPVSAAQTAAFAPIAHVTDTTNPHSTTKAQVGLGNVDNTSDVNKPVSAATATALGLKINTSASTTFGLSLLGAADAPTTRTLLGLGTAATAAASSFAPIAHVTDTTNPHSTTKAQVGLGNVDNTSDVNKPVSTATTSALALKTDIAALGGSSSVDHLKAMSLANQISKAGHTVVLMGASTMARSSNEYPCTISTYQRVSGVVTVQCNAFPDADVGRLIRLGANNDGRIDCHAIIISATPAAGNTTIVASEIVTGATRPNIALGSVSSTSMWVFDAASYNNTSSWVPKMNANVGGILDITNLAVGGTTPEDWVDADRRAYIETSLPIFDTAIVDFGLGNAITNPTQSAEVIYGYLDQALAWATKRARHVIFLGLAGARLGGDSALVASPETTADTTTGTRVDSYLRSYILERWPTVEFVDIGSEFAAAAMFATTGQAQAVTTNTITLAKSAVQTDGYYVGADITIVAGTGAGQTVRQITGYVGTTRVATLDSTWVTTPDTFSVYSIDSNDDLVHGRPARELIGSDGIHWTPTGGDIIATALADTIMKHKSAWSPFMLSYPDFVFLNTTADGGGGYNPNGLYSWAGPVPTTSVSLAGIGTIGTGIQGTSVSGSGLTVAMSAALSVVDSGETGGGKEMQLIFNDPSDGGATVNVQYAGTTAFPIVNLLNDARFRNVDVDAWFDYGIFGFKQDGVFNIEVALFGTTATDTRLIAAWISNRGSNGMFGAGRAWTRGHNGWHRTPKFRIPSNTYTGGYIQISVVGSAGVPLGTMKIRMGRLRLAVRQALI